MNWSKIQSALIILFLAINIFLLCNIAYSNISLVHSEKKDLEKTVEILKINNVLLPEQLPKTPRMQVLSVENVLADTISVADKLFENEDFITEETGNVTVCKNQTKNLVISGGFIEYKSLEETTTPSRKKAEQLLLELGFDVKNARVSASDTKLVFEGMYGGKKIYSNKLTVELSEDKISYIRGRWANVTGKATSKTKIVPVQNAFINLLRDGVKNVSVSQVEAGYEIITDPSNSDYKTAEAVPVWNITTDNGLSRFYDARR